MASYPDTVTLSPKSGINRDIAVPGSKSLTNRALVVAALAAGESCLRGALIAEDSEVMIDALTELGIAVQTDGTTFRVAGQGGRIPAKAAMLDLKLSGTSIRFLTALVALGAGEYILDGNARMRQRPIQDLLTALSALGVTVDAVFGNGCPPVRVVAQGLQGGVTQIAGDRSSQYLSALLMAAPYARAPVTIEVSGTLQSKPFIDMTLALMQDFGVAVERCGYARFSVAPQRYTARDYLIEGDAMAAGYFWAIAAVTGGRVKVTNVGHHSVQGDKRLADVLGQMGCQVRWTASSCEVTGPSGRLQGGTFDLNDMPDQAQTLAVLALFADSPVTITNVWNMRIKETDRLSALYTELRKFGVRVDEAHDAITVYPLHGAPSRPVTIDTYGDHRMAMAFAVAGMKLPGVTINNPSCVAKTFPDFFEVLAAL
jgi:3-phosphoshikimate 1-carboxyvinyltransferase